MAMSRSRGGIVVDHAVVDDDLAAGHRLEAGDHPQDRALAAAGRPDEDDELAVADLEVDAVDDLQLAVFLDQITTTTCAIDGQPLTAPAVSAPTIRRCSTRKTMTAGTMESTLAAASVCVESLAVHSLEIEDADRDRQERRLADEE